MKYRHLVRHLRRHIQLGNIGLEPVQESNVRYMDMTSIKRMTLQFKLSYSY